MIEMHTVVDANTDHDREYNDVEKVESDTQPTADSERPNSANEQWRVCEQGSER